MQVRLRLDLAAQPVQLCLVSNARIPSEGSVDTPMTFDVSCSKILLVFPHHRIELNVLHDV